MKAALILPHQLVEKLPFTRDEVGLVFLYEDPLFFTQLPFHKAKLVFHKASMLAYASLLKQQQFKVEVIPFKSTENSLQKQLSAHGVLSLCLIDPVDDYALKNIKSALGNEVSIELFSNPSFLLTETEALKFLGDKKTYRFSEFYKKMRHKLSILIDSSGQPEGGQYSFDADNRKRMPKGHVPPALPQLKASKTWSEATQWVEEHFPNNPGEIGLVYPVEHVEARKWLSNFINEKLKTFGPYEDFISTKEPFIYHSLLSPLLNSGLISPYAVIKSALSQKDVPLASLEGFLRQVIGWREFIRALYIKAGRKERTRNFFNFSRKLPKSFWKGTTGIEPVDHAIQNVLKTGYCHHIERLMVLGCFMLLCEIDPDEVYAWFMELFIDAYDWVMVPNVYGMSQFADGGLFATKPYICGSNYILKMSDHKKGPWCDVWDGLYWRFIEMHRDLFLKNHRSSMLVKTLEKMDPERKKRIFDAAETFLTELDLNQ